MKTKKVMEERKRENKEGVKRRFPYTEHNIAVIIIPEIKDPHARSWLILGCAFIQNLYETQLYRFSSVFKIFDTKHSERRTHRVNC